jgi:hypothetical protein
MRRGWRRVAECGDNRAFAPAEVSAAIIPALAQDCQAELSPEFIARFSGMYRDREASLFTEPLTPQLEALRGIAGSGLGRVLLDHAIQLSERGETGFTAAEKATTAALTDRAGRGSRQVEEHYCRESSAPRAVAVRARIEEAIDSARGAIEELAQRTLQGDGGAAARMPKQQGLDEGVRL